MNLSRPDRPDRLDRLAAEYALGTSPPRVRRRLAAIARRDTVVAAALDEWSQRLAVLGTALPEVDPPARTWDRIAARLGWSATAYARPSWWNRLAVWRAATAVFLAAAVALGVLQTVGKRAPAPGIVVILAGSDAKPAMIAAAAPGEEVLHVKSIGATLPPAGRVFELWGLPKGAAPRALGVIPAGAVVELPTRSAAVALLASFPALAVSVEPPGGSPTGVPTGPVVFTGQVEQMF